MEDAPELRAGDDSGRIRISSYESHTAANVCRKFPGVSDVEIIDVIKEKCPDRDVVTTELEERTRPGRDGDMN